MERTEKEEYAPDVESYEGMVPAWLIVVYVGLIIWGIYYLIKYWDYTGSGI